jgi:hypothetical protein
MADSRTPPHETLQNESDIFSRFIEHVFLTRICGNLSSVYTIQKLGWFTVGLDFGWDFPLEINVR